MQRYVPVPIPGDAPEWFKTWARDHTNNLQRAARDANDFSNNVVLHKEPPRYSAGIEVYADGTDWNPGSGEGKYRRNAANTAWVFIG